MFTAVVVVAAVAAGRRRRQDVRSNVQKVGDIFPFLSRKSPIEEWVDEKNDGWSYCFLYRGRG